MARVKSRLLRKLESILTHQFPSPDTVKLEENDGIIGVITSPKFVGMETIDRQNQIWNIVETHLSKEEQRRVQVIVGVTSDEGTGYLAGVE